ncbi:sensor histidine kinase [Prauserella alba]|uniref:histidine kinase n=1 Tax=Prauserella alba TaxID=176898 RepID=A0ABP4GD62_9PSEU|nr:ATP-binding protein [Prauserella alba]MCP2183778.1 two-component system, OmpR family, sensor kinase [Prauserella alba]
MRARLIGELLALLAVICLIIGVVTEIALSAFLVHELDEQLGSAGDRAVQVFDRPGRGPDTPRPAGPPPDPLNARGVSPGTIAGLVVDGSLVHASMLGDDGDPRPLGSPAEADLLDVPVDGEPRTVSLGDLGDYRVSALRNELGDVVITGLPLDDIHETLLGVGLILGGVSLIGLAVTGVSGAFVVRRTLRPLERMADTAGEVTQLPLHTGEVDLPVRVPDVDSDGRTEVGRVGAALNRMLGHVGDALDARQQSEMRVRRFVADASHELRTPLASISGYTQLIRRSDESLSAETTHALRRIESEAGRMTTLVEDMLLLARLDAGRPLATDEVDLSALVVDAVGDATVAMPGRRWRLDVPPEPVTIRGDEARLHQVIANLLSNAGKHTPEGTTVTAALSASDEGVTLSVADDGPGIPGDLAGIVFERFARGEASRSRATGSTGLGLAVVSAVVGAHRGTVDLDSEPGRTVFTVRLPAN